ncbi:zinc finger CCCH domain-containing protein 62-like [Aristolochia californica]|uniref:zinc finger CCCH domain-containing protein 62-like n=1 Tax=Aristolochia californica TaxID=171875 RepID=UPI0035D74D65
MTKRDQQYVCISSSSSESEESDDDDDDDVNCSSPSDDGSELSDEEIDQECDSDDGSELSGEDIDQEAVEDDSDDLSGDDEAYCDKVVALLKGGRDLHALKLEECKAYLRKHGLRITGTKETCIQRIQEHWRIKDGRGEKLYPRSSFMINCTGDVCRGDIVLFRQRVYQKYDLARKGGNLIGKRTIAGRVVKESYGAAKQQHTFTVEVLWSKGLKTLPPLFPLLVKGRNLYRLKTLRQVWDDEAEREKVLAEKHRRGGEARLTRAIKKAQAASRGPNCHRNLHHTKAPPKEKKPERCPPRKRKRADCDDFPVPRNANVSRDAKRKTHEPTSSGSKQKKHTHQTTINKRLKSHDPRVVFERGPLGSTYSHIAVQSSGNFVPFTGYRGMCSSSNYNIGSGSTTYPTAVSTFNHEPLSRRNNFNTGRAYPSHRSDPRRLNRSILLPCSTPGCGDSAARDCVGCYCWKCCMRVGRRCLRHKY